MGWEVEWEKWEQAASANKYAGFSERDALGVRSVARWAVPAHSDPKASAAFIQGYCRLYEQTNRRDHLDKAVVLGNELLSTSVGGGWAEPSYLPFVGSISRGTPSAQVTVFCAQAILNLFQLTHEDRFLKAAQSSKGFLLDTLPLIEQTPYLRSFGEKPGSNQVVVSSHAMAAAFLAELYLHTGDASDLRMARKLVQWVLSVKLPDHSWKASNRWQTGLILSSLWGYIEKSGEVHWRRHYWDALIAYEQGLSRSWSGLDLGQSLLTLVKASRWDATYHVRLEVLQHWLAEKLALTPSAQTIATQAWLFWSTADFLGLLPVLHKEAA